MFSWKGLAAHNCMSAFCIKRALRILIAFTWGMSISIKMGCTQVLAEFSIHYIGLIPLRRRTTEGHA